MLQKVVVVGGLGQMGRLVSRSLADSGITVTVLDLHADVAATESNWMEFVQCDVGAPGVALREVVASADCVWVCLPEKISLEIGAGLAAAMPDGCLWVDTLSVKANIVAKIENERGRLEAISINPMFAPRMGWGGNAVAVVDVLAGRKSVFLEDLMTTWGCRLEPVTAEEHDRLTANIPSGYIYAAVLAFGAALLHLQVDLEKTLRLSTPPYRLLLALLDRMTTQSSDVYWDIQAYHSLAGDVRREMTSALQKLDQDAGAWDARGFTDTFARLNRPLAWQRRAIARMGEECFRDDALLVSSDR